MSHQEIVQKAMDFDMDIVVRRYMKDYELPREVAEEHEKELKRYLALNAINPPKAYGMRGQVDEIWHTFLLFTKEYQRFCKEVGGKFIHHIPNTHLSVPERSTYFNTLEDYKEIFGEAPPEHIWPAVSNPNNPLDSANLDVCSTSCRGCGSGCSSCGSGCSGCTSCSAGN